MARRVSITVDRRVSASGTSARAERSRGPAGAAPARVSRADANGAAANSA